MKETGCIKFSVEKILFNTNYIAGYYISENNQEQEDLSFAHVFYVFKNMIIGLTISILCLLLELTGYIRF